MQADYIQDIIKKIGKLPYKCILFDGVWGIGKTYAVNEALKDQENVCKISMFGLQSSQQIYHEILFQSALKNSKAGAVGEFASDVLSSLATIWDGVAKAKDILQNVAKEKELFLMLAKAFETWHTIVIDDLERISDSIKMEEVLGIVEELKKCRYVKIVLVANIEEIQGENKEVFQRYNEKVVDRIYQITERPEIINWGAMGIHAGFMQEFLAVHKVKNLRTLQKAQKFFDDVKLYCNEIKNDQFLDEVRLICYAVVVESTDNLYYQELSESDKSSRDAAYKILRNDLEHRIINYLSCIRSGGNFVTMLRKYYFNECVITAEDMLVGFKLYVRAGAKPNFYKTDTEIKQIIPILHEDMKKAQNIGELNKYADECIIWSEIIGWDYVSILEDYRTKVHEMLLSNVLDGHEEILGYNIDLWHVSSKKVQQTYTEERDLIRKLLIKNYVDYLVETTKGEQAYRYSYKLREYCGNQYYEDAIKEYVGVLWREQSFPIGDIDALQYDTCYNIMCVLYHIDEEKFSDYCRKLSEGCDRMSAHRLEELVKRIV